MIGSTFKGMIRLLGGLAAGLAIIMMLAAWKLSAGPISLAFLSPHIERALNAGRRTFTISLEDTILTWGGWERSLDIRVLNVRATAKGGEVIASVPELSLSLSLRAMMRGLVAPRTIDLFRPSIRLRRHGDGNFEVGFSNSGLAAAEQFERILDEILTPPDAASAMGYLTRVSVIDADLRFEDGIMDTTWWSPSTQAIFIRGASGIKGEVSLDLEADGQRHHFTVLGEYLAAGRRLDLGVSFSQVTPATFSRLTPELEPLSAFDLPLEGTLTFSMSVGGAIEMIGFDLAGSAGSLVLPEPMKQSLDVARTRLRGRYMGASEWLVIDDLFVELSKVEKLSLPAPHDFVMSVKSARANGHFEGTAKTLQVDDLSIDFGAKGELTFPAPTSHKFPLKSLRAHGRYLAGQGRVEVAALDLDLKGPTLSASGAVSGLGGEMTAAIKGKLNNLAVDDFARYWPRAWGEETQTWCVANLSAGKVSEARAEIEIRSAAQGGFDVTSLAGGMDIENVTVNYLDPMPKATKATGTAKFDTKRFDIFLTHGETGELTVDKGSILFSGLDQYDQIADIELFIDGPVNSALELIEHEPLGFASAVGIAPFKTGGASSTRLKLDFILEHALSQDKVKVSASSKLKDVFVGGVVFANDLSEGQLALEVDNQGMDVSGRIKLGGVGANLAWRENFSLKAPFRSRYDLKGSVLEVPNLADLGLDLEPLPDDFISGSVGADVGYTVGHDKTSRLEIKADLSETALALPRLGWAKEAGVVGTAEIVMDLKGDMVRDIPRFQVAAGDLSLAGSASYEMGGRGLKRIDLDKISYGGTDMAGMLIPGDDGGWTISFHGPNFDLAPMFDDLFKDEPEREDQAGLRFSLSADLDRVWLGPGKYLERVRGTFTRDGDRWRGIVMEGLVGKNKPFQVELRPGEGGNRRLAIRAEDAGAVLKTFGFYDNMIGGVLEVTGDFDDAAPDSPLQGRLAVDHYRIIDAPALAHLVSYLALTGILESLQGDGLSFNTLEVPFVLAEGVLEVTDARAAGLSLGYTAGGKIYTHADMVDMKGTVVPAYAINSVLGNIPILGDILTGGEKGGGVFAATYQMAGPMENPTVTVNPLSALAPGFLRNLFGIFDRDPATSEAPKDKGGEATQKP